MILHGADVGDRQIGVDGPDGLLHFVDEGLGAGAIGADGEVDGAPGVERLRDR